jgi:hypothetical protein
MANRTSPSPELGHIRVSDCMHHGILGCAGDAPLGEVAGVMAKRHVHAVAITNGVGERPVDVVSALDVVGAAASREECQGGIHRDAPVGERCVVPYRVRRDRSAALVEPALARRGHGSLHSLPTLGIEQPRKVGATLVAKAQVAVEPPPLDGGFAGSPIF